jgi:hypothetical protein
LISLKMEPCGTLPMTFAQKEYTPFILTCCLQSFRKAAIHCIIS